MPTIADISNVTYSGDMRVDALLDSTTDWNYLLRHRTTLFYTFDLSEVDAATSAPVFAFSSTEHAATDTIFLCAWRHGHQFCRYAIGYAGKLSLCKQ